MNSKSLFKKLSLDKLLGKSLAVLFLRVFGLLLFFALTLYLTNNFDIELVGMYDFTRSSLLIIGGVCLLGTNQAIIYFSGILIARKDLYSLKGIYFKMLVILLIICVLFLLVIEVTPPSMINKYFEKEDAYTLLEKVIFSLFPFALMLLNFDTIRGLKKTTASEIYRNILRYTPFFIACIYILTIAKQFLLINSFLFGFFVVAFISTIHVFWLFSKLPRRQECNYYGYKVILKVSAPMALSAVSFFLMQSIDIILLGKYESFETVAFYGVAVKLSTAASLVLVSVTIILGPKISELYEKAAFLELRKLLATGTKIIILLSFPGIILLILFPSFFLNFFGDGYNMAKTPLIILLIAQLFVSFCGPAAIYLNMTGRHQLLNKIILLGLVLNVLLNFLFIPSYGMKGAASATAISLVVWNLIAVIYVYKKDDIVMPNFIK